MKVLFRLKVAALAFLFAERCVRRCAGRIEALSSFFRPTSDAPEASSSVLRLQALYLQQPPHDTALYDCLEVSPNATAGQIAQSYRRLCRKYHPDKQRGQPPPSSGENGGSSSSSWDRVQEAYKVLKDDTTRLAYHRYGLLDPSQAVRILSGSDASAGTSRAHAELLQLMGYPAPWEDGGPPRAVSKEERVERIARNLAERLRVLVEDQISWQSFVDAAVQDCDRLKRLPLGAHILRCVGRAYRHAGEKALMAEGPESPLLLWTERLLERFRGAKDMATAAMASGRAMVAAQRLEKRKAQWDRQRRKVPAARITYHFDSELGELTPSLAEGDSDNDALDDFDALHQHDLQQQQHLQTQSTLLEALQIEALWKVIKIELDQVVRQACEKVLGPDDCFFCSYDTTGDSAHSTTTAVARWDGWVGHRSGASISVAEGRRRAAVALVTLGNVLVRQSKEGTSWLE